MKSRQDGALGVTAVVLGTLIIALAAVIAWSALSSDSDQAQTVGGTGTPTVTSAPRQPEVEDPEETKPFRSLRQRSIE